ncbi:MAG: nucleotidyltransferase domain-containing protein [Candidatus Eisenbacteria bacterium]|uniref:Nucleotidyltransferase domain-containing protein n=1 Tax=Eiseniibacteriota bacterium TaxID=2212470 RepID=A0A937XBJ5_UNCEI|nr:nucleotidyltransferase domain-containing protein [Candidatus Eisenbacteria bacterium]
MDTLVDLLGSRVKAEILRLLFGPGAKELHVREIGRQAGLADATVRQELRRLTRLGIVGVRRDGNRVCYQANAAHPLYPDIHSLVLKTSGLVDVLRDALGDPGVRLAFVFGSLAAGTDKPESDVDLMVVGTISLRQMAGRLSGVGDRLGREVNPHVMTDEEFGRRRNARDHFLVSVLRSPRLWVIGSEDELAAMGR